MLNDVKTVLELMSAQGPFAFMAAIFAAMWWFERKEVKSLTVKVTKLTAVALVARQRLGDDK